ncbi:hypothetical protein CM49_02324 [Paenibacillus sp. P1XP2]|nr:hypothetical protein CM49_02324 [Paenibacillus sp. P1XP2]
MPGELQDQLAGDKKLLLFAGAEQIVAAVKAPSRQIWMWEGSVKKGAGVTEPSAPIQKSYPDPLMDAQEE